MGHQTLGFNESFTDIKKCNFYITINTFLIIHQSIIVYFSHWLHKVR